VKKISVLCLFFLQEITEMKLVLASESQFHKRAMDLLGIPYETRPARIDEKAIRADNRAELTRKIADAKANKIGAVCPNSVVVSGDAVEAKGDRIFEKPSCSLLTASAAATTWAQRYRQAA
jgi:predicted house-cleaning NTP pyrophosphatase (Maf/HAM1 superfamily)